MDSPAPARNTKLRAVTDAKGRLIGFLLSAGQISEDTGAAGGLPKADWLQESF